MGLKRQGALHQRLCPFKKLLKRRIVEPSKDQHLSPGEESCVEFKARVFGGSTDERDRPVFHIGEEAILLAAVEAVNFVDEENGFALVIFPISFSLIDDNSNVFDASANG